MLCVFGVKIVKVYYNVCGWVVYVFGNFWGFILFGEGVNWGVIMIGLVWFCYYFWEYYFFIGDCEFLKIVYLVFWELV